MPSFVTNARHFLVTYAQCGDLSEWRVLDKFTSLGAECIIAREQHEDLGLHFHVFADFGRKFRSRKVDIFDVDGRHPNIKRSWGTPEKGYDYAIKDGDIVAGGLERPIGVHGSGKTFDLWSEIAGAENRGDFWRLCEELDPKSLCCSFGQLSKFADWRFAEPDDQYGTPHGIDFDVQHGDGRDSWVQESGIHLGEPLVGE
ncbi:Rep1 [Olive associated gemycircularvirus 1]|uniref:Rep1 n=1 Tax=Olive associated gemycircularvirus 1 TaxID=2518602 RepID=A0A411PW92_9VIRU|nr:Rep1 [Olive associated gemycircularvirus 1]QBG49357.1 Rep1 [Olive associated gemycircularvirus 1]